MRDELRNALELHRTGRLSLAAQAYERILAGRPDDAEALHLLGILHHQRGEHARAVELIGRAVAIVPSSHIYQANLAEAYRALGDFERAAGCCRAALQIWPDYPEAHCNLGAALEGQGKPAEAALHLRRAIALRPDYVVAHNNLGITLRTLDETEQALEHLRRAVALDPTYSPAQTNLGQTLLSQGDAASALPFCQEAARLDPRSAILYHNLGNVLRILDRLADAQAAYREAVRLNPDLAVAQAHLGLVLQREGSLKDALTPLCKAVELEPANISYMEWLAELYDELEEPADSIPWWERIIALDPDRVGPHLALGWAYQEEGRREDARLQYLKVIELQPNSGQAHLNLGGLYEELGEMDRAEASFREALKLQPDFAIPHARLATLLRGKLPAEDMSALESRLDDNSLALGPRARLLFALAHALDARGDYARAAECLREANRITTELVPSRRDYDPAAHERFVDGLIRAFTPEFHARLTGQGLESSRPVFVFGLPRSGTTLIEQVLASHSRIHGAGELRLARRSFDRVPTLLGRSGPPADAIENLDSVNLRLLAGQHLEWLAAIDGGTNDRIVDKMPDNYMYIALLAAMFPRAVFVHCRRDLRDVAVSCWMTDFRNIRWANIQDHIAGRFQCYRRLMNHWQSALPLPLVEVDYEETVNDLESVARRIVDACGLAWEPACLNFHQTTRAVKTASLTQVRQPVYQRSVARWKNYQSELAELFAALTAEPDHGGQMAPQLADVDDRRHLSNLCLL